LYPSQIGNAVTVARPKRVGACPPGARSAGASHEKSRPCARVRSPPLGERVADAFAESARAGNELALRVLPGGGPAVFVALSCSMAGPNPSWKDQQAHATTDEEVVRNLDSTH